MPQKDLEQAKQTVQQSVKEAKEGVVQAKELASQVKDTTGKAKAVLDALSEKRVQQAIRAMEQGNYEDALAEVNRVLAEHPHNAEALSLKGMNLALAGDWKKGLQSALAAHHIDPTNVKNFYDLAIIYKLGNQLDESKVWFEQVLDQDPKHLWSTYGIATIYADQGKDQEALQWLQKAIQLDESVKGIAKEQDHFERFRSMEVFQELVK